MADEKPQITIPDLGGPVAPSPFEKKAEEKFRNIDALLYAVVVAVVITAISGLISVGAIVIDQLHFNNQTYRESSEKSDMLNPLNELNKTLIEELKNSQQLILEQQKQIRGLTDRPDLKSNSSHIQK